MSSVKRKDAHSKFKASIVKAAFEGVITYYQAEALIFALNLEHA